MKKVIALSKRRKTMRKYTAAAIAAMIVSMTAMSQPAFAEELLTAVSDTADSESYSFEELLAMSEEEIGEISDAYAESLALIDNRIVWVTRPVVQYQLYFENAIEFLKEDVVDKAVVTKLLGIPSDMIVSVRNYVTREIMDGTEYGMITLCIGLDAYEDYDAYTALRAIEVYLRTHSKIDLVEKASYGDPEPPASYGDSTTHYSFDEMLAMSDEEISAISDTHAEIIDYGHDSSAITWFSRPAIQYRLHFLDASEVLNYDDIDVDKDALLELLGLPDDIVWDVSPWIDHANVNGVIYDRIMLYAVLDTYENYDVYRVQRTLDVFLKTNSKIDCVYPEYYLVESEVSPSETNGEVTDASLYGDVDCDDDVDIIDVIALNKYLLLGELIADQGAVNADVDKNGSVNASDSLNILKYVVGIIDGFDAQ